MKIFEFPFKFSSITLLVTKLLRSLLAVFETVHTGECHAQERQSVSTVKMFASGTQTDIKTERTDIQLLIKTNLILTLTQSKNFKLYRNLPVELFSVSCHSVDS